MTEPDEAEELFPGIGRHVTLIGFMGVQEVGLSPDRQPATRSYMAPQHLYTARYNAQLCSQHEVMSSCIDRELRIKHRSHAITAVMSSVAFLEALVNEVFKDAVDLERQNVATGVDYLDDEYIARMAIFWGPPNNGQRLGMLDKYQLALRLVGGTPFEAGAEPWQGVNALVKLRNHLVHFVPESTPHDAPEKLETLLGHRFEPCLINWRSSAWFPDKCLGAGCAAWACQVVADFAAEWVKRMGLDQYYEINTETGHFKQHAALDEMRDGE